MKIKDLLTRNVNDRTEKKNGLTYLSWAWAWTEVLLIDEKATFEVKLFGDKCYMDINGTAMVFVTVTIFEKPMTCQLPVIDYRNKAITNPDAFQINTSIMRCLAKAIGLHGLGLYIYAGEDVPEDGDGNTPTKIIPANAACKEELAALSIDEQTYIRDLNDELEDLLKDGRINESFERVQAENLTNEQRMALWAIASSGLRSGIKKIANERKAKS